MEHPAIPDSFGDITPRWLTSALRVAGFLNRRAVVACDVDPVGQERGFASRVARLVPTYDAPDGEAPSSMIAKLAPTGSDAAGSERQRQQCLREAAFYSEIGSSAGIATPRCFYVACDDGGSRFVVLLEDLSTGRFGDDAIGCARRDAELVVDSLAAFHARWWNSTRLSEYGWLPVYADAASQIEKLQVRRQSFLEQYGDLVPSEIRELTENIGPQHAGALEILGDPPTTLLHLDPHLDNVAFLGPPDNVRVVLFDWQGVTKGLGVVDLALFVVSSWAEHQTRDDAILLERYHKGLISHGVSDYPLDRLRRDYSAALLRRWIGTVNGLSTAHARTWTGRQAEVARRSVAKWTAVLTRRPVLDWLVR